MCIFEIMNTWKLPLLPLNLGTRFTALVMTFACVGVFEFVVGPLSAEARVLRHRATGFRVNAPNGFRLRYSRGIYSVRKGRDSATIMKISSPMNNRSTARSLVKSARLKRARIRGGATRSIITGLYRGRPIYIELKGKGPVYTVLKYVTPKRTARAKMTPVLTLRDIAALRRIGNSARGGVLSPFQISIPVRRFTEGGATTLVPALPGWNSSGAGGALSGGRAGQGFFALGIYIPNVTRASARDAIIFDWNRLNGVVVRGIEIVPGSEQFLGSAGAFDSGMFTVRFDLDGFTYDGIMSSGVFNPGGRIDWYYSVVAVRTGQFPGLGPTLWNQTWGTWNASAAQANRFAQTIATIRTTPTVAIDRRVFDRIQDAWVQYIRR